MAGLFHTLNMGASSLFANRQGVDTTGHNIANAQTEGFSRQRVNLEQRFPQEIRGLLLGNGVFVRNITRAHDKFLENQINDHNQTLGQSNTRHDEIKSIEEIFSPELSSSISDEMVSFFNTLQDLSSFPEEITVRTAVKEYGQNLVNSFKRVDTRLREYQNDINFKLKAETEEINRILDDMARLNIQINTAEAGQFKKANDLRDQQDRLLRELSHKMEINYYRGDMGGLVVHGPNDRLLVDRNWSASMHVQHNSAEDLLYDVVVVDSKGKVASIVTEKNSKGRLHGLVRVRDHDIEELLSQNNTLAHSFVKNFNAVHRQGYGINSFSENTGRDFFVEVSDDQIDHAVRELRLSDYIMSSTDAISAAGRPNAPGDNINLNNLLRLKDDKLMANGNATFNDYYANMVSVFGLEVVREGNANEANKVIGADLKSRREAVAGVSLDEEAANLLRWQTAFTASSRVITTVDEMLETVLGLKR
tara:strand:- start:3954 stop:5384 length:1431 start_codon:yes stop_codon:yes gene_type:complete